MSKITNLAIERAGGPTAVAAALSLTRQAVSKWEHIPAKHVRKIESMSGVSRYQLRPDIYGEGPSDPLASSGTVAA